MSDKSDLLAELVASDATIKEQAKEIERLRNEVANLEERFNDACANARFQHNELECKAVAELLEFLHSWPQNTGHHDLGLEGRLEVYCADCVMGTIEDDGNGSFHYYPLAFGKYGETEGTRKNI